MFPAYKKKLVLSQKNGITGDIITALNDSFPQSVKATKKLAERLDSGDIYDDANKVWSLIRHKINYVKDPDGVQVIQLPQALVARGLKVNGNKNGGDCKSMSLMAAGLLHNMGAKNVRLRYAGYFGEDPSHVYCVISVNGRDVPVDPVIDKFDYEKPYKFKKDYKMDVYQLSGIGDAYTDKLEKIKSKLPKGSIHFNLVNKEILKASKGIDKVSINPIEAGSYLQKLEALKRKHIDSGKTGYLYKLVDAEIDRVKQGFVYGSISGIGKDSFLKKAFKSVEKVSLAPSRNAFLGLIEINVKGLATKLKGADRKKVSKLWEKFGGNPEKLYKSIDRGAQKKSLFGVGAVDPATGSALAASAPILAAFIALFKKEKTPKVDANGQPILDANGKPVMEETKGFWSKLKEMAPDLLSKGLKAARNVVQTTPQGEVEVNPNLQIVDAQPTSAAAIPQNLLIFGGIGLAALLILRKK